MSARHVDGPGSNPGGRTISILEVRE